MAENKTQQTEVNPEDFIRQIDYAGRRADALELNQLFGRITGFQPRMWGPTIVGYGQYHYKYESGREGDMPATGFSPRKANMVVYVVPGYDGFEDLMRDLGKHRTGKSCLYLGALKNVDMDVLGRLIRAGLDDLATRWVIKPS
ncbi:MAG: DUF1801 domain-containing protein [Paracoccaceae bacterium]